MLGACYVCCVCCAGAVGQRLDPRWASDASLQGDALSSPFTRCVSLQNLSCITIFIRLVFQSMPNLTVSVSAFAYVSVSSSVSQLHHDHFLSFPVSVSISISVLYAHHHTQRSERHIFVFMLKSTDTWLASSNMKPSQIHYQKTSTVGTRSETHRSRDTEACNAKRLVHKAAKNGLGTVEEEENSFCSVKAWGISNTHD